MLRLSTIRARILIVFVLTVLLAAAAISSVTVILGTQDGRQREIDQLESVVTLKQAEIKTWVKGLRANLDIITSEFGELNDIQTIIQKPNEKERNEIIIERLHSRFKWVADSMGLFDELFFMDLTGKILISTNSTHENEYHTKDSYFIEGLRGSYIQPPSYSLSLGKMTAVISSPVISNGTVLGVIAGTAGLQGLNDIMIERAGLGSTGETYLVGSNHHLLTELRDQRYSIPDAYIRTKAANAAVDEFSSGSDVYSNYNNKTVIGVYRWLPELKVALLAEQEEEEALYSTMLALKLIGGVAFLAIILAILIALFLTSTIIKPLAELAATAKVVADGNFEKTVAVKRNDEIGIVARAFNTMTARLRLLVRNLERRTDQLRAINETGRQASSILHLNELLNYVASSLQKNFTYHNVGIILIDQESKSVVLRASAGAYEGSAHITQGTIETDSIVNSIIQTGQSLLINDILSDPKYRDTEGSGRTRSELAVPIKIGDRLVGILDIEEDHTNAFDDLDVFTTQTLADQLAIAIENARLYEQARELATMEERQRLARDLHDAVSQTLFSASLIADVLPRLWERNPAEGRKRLEEIRQLTRGALAEMRSLLLELRPSALVDAEPGELLSQLSESITGRARIPVVVEIETECKIKSPELKVAFYRIAQEALNNVAKHSGASQAKVSLCCKPASIELVISDNGNGFNIDSNKPNNLGLGIMRERAKAIGASINIISSPEKGTTVSVIWRNTQEEKTL
jgi:nitrate/nitrite-specific signal transduction histidine kinase